MGKTWSVAPETHRLSGLKRLSAQTGGASDSWVLREPTVRDIRAALDDSKASKGKKTDVDLLIERNIVDGEGGSVFGGDNPEFLDLSGHAATELTDFVLATITKSDAEDEDPGKS